LSSGNTLLTLLIYSAAAVTFAYSCRFLLLTFTGEKSQYAKEMKVHEAPRLMSFSSSILAAGCIILGLLGGPLASFLHTGFIFDFADFFGLESLIFVVTLLVGGLPIYLIYQRGVIPLEKFREGSLVFLDKVLERGLYFDSMYTGIANGLMSLSRIHQEVIEDHLIARVPSIVASSISRIVHWIYRIVEVNILERIPDLVARGITRFAYGFHKVVELNDLESIPDLVAVGSMKLANAALKRFDKTLDKLAYTTANATASHSVRIRRLHSGSLPHFVLAAIAGFIFLCCLLLLTL